MQLLDDAADKHDADVAVSTVVRYLPVPAVLCVTHTRAPLCSRLHLWKSASRR